MNKISILLTSIADLIQENEDNSNELAMLKAHVDQQALEIEDLKATIQKKRKPSTLKTDTIVTENKED